MSNKFNNSMLISLIIWLTLFIPIFSDWEWKNINISDILLVLDISLFCYYFKKTKIKKILYSEVIFLVLFILVFNNLTTIFYSSNIEYVKTIYFSFKLIAYVIFVVLGYNFFYYSKSISNLKDKLIKIAILTGVVGIIITLLLYLNSDIPQKFIWVLTRVDKASYTFRGTQIIRARSFFSEPSYLGVFLNLALAIELFTEFKVKRNLKKAFILMTFSFTTMALSSVFTTIFILCLYFLFVNNSILKNKKILLILIAFTLIGAFVFREIIYETIILRIFVILQGRDTSTINRLLVSWQQVTGINFLIGNGIGNTPAIWNNLAYILSDFGIAVFLGYLCFIYKIFSYNKLLVFSFILFNFLRGGYLNSYYWFSVLIVIIFSLHKELDELDNVFNNSDVTTIISSMNLDLNKELPFYANGNVLICNQCENFSHKIVNYNQSKFDIYNTNERGVSLSRNFLIDRVKSKIFTISDDDIKYNENYRSSIAEAFNEFPDADVLVFNLAEENPNHPIKRYVIREAFEIDKINFTRFGAVRISCKTKSIRDKNIKFNLNYGPGSKYGSGEDTLFLNDCLSSGLKIIAVPVCIGLISSARESTWFEGFNEKYFFDKGALYSEINQNLFYLNALQYSLRKSKITNGKMTWLTIFKLMIYGHKSRTIKGEHYEF